MAGRDNLITQAQRSPEERRAIASAGGKASQQKQRQKRQTKALIRQVLDSNVKLTKKQVGQLMKAGVDADADNPTIELLGIVAIANAFMSGDLAAAKFLYDYAQVPDLRAQMEIERQQAQADAEKADAAAPAPAGLPLDVVLGLLGPAWLAVARDVFAHGHTHYNFSGGRGSLKSSTVSLLVPLLLMLHPQTHALVLRKVGNTLRDSVFSQYVWAIGELGMADSWTAKVAPMELIYKPTGQRIMFRGADDPMKIKSIKAPFGYIAVTHFEELDQFAGRDEVRNILQSTMRGGSTFWNFETYNPPITRDSWVNRDGLEERADRLRHHSTYLEAPAEWLGPQFLAEAEYIRDTDERAYRHDYLGEATGSGGEVFDNLEIREITDGELAGFDRILMGVDWGWYPDPFHWAKVHWEPARRTLYLIDEYRANKQSNAETWEALKTVKGVREFDLITADSAEEKSIQDYRAYGSMCRGAIKGPDSRRYGFKWLQSLKAIVIDPARCPNAVKEFRAYEYERNRDGEILNSYPDGNDHSIDAVRYATESIWRRKGQ